MAYDLSKGAPAPKPEAQIFKGYVATVTLYADRAQIKRKLMGKVTGAKDAVIPSVTSSRCSPRSRLDS